MAGFFLGEFISGFFVKSVASFDDTLTRVPVIAHLTRGVKGKLAFSFGTLIALSTVLVIVVFFSSLLEFIPHPNLVIAFLILVLAFFVYFEIFTKKPEEKLKQKIDIQKFSRLRFFRLVGIGFLVSFVTLLDDSIILTSLFVEHHSGVVFAIAGIYAATLIQIGVVIYFGGRLNKVKYKKELASFSLIVLAALVYLGIV